MRPYEPCQEDLEFPATGKMLLSKSKNFKIAVFIGLLLSHLRPIVYVLDTGAGPNIIRADVLDTDRRDISATAIFQK